MLCFLRSLPQAAQNGGGVQVHLVLQPVKGDLHPPGLALQGDEPPLLHDLQAHQGVVGPLTLAAGAGGFLGDAGQGVLQKSLPGALALQIAPQADKFRPGGQQGLGLLGREIGRASCRERV